MDRWGPKHVEVKPKCWLKLILWDHIVYLVGLYIYYKMIHGPYNVKSIFLRSMSCCHGSGGYSTSCHHGGPGSIPRQSVRDFWRKVVSDSFSTSISVFLCQCHSTNAPGSSSSPLCYYRKDRFSRPENLLRSNYLSEMWGHLLGGGGSYFIFFSLREGNSL